MIDAGKGKTASDSKGIYSRYDRDDGGVKEHSEKIIVLVLILDQGRVERHQKEHVGPAC